MKKILLFILAALIFAGCGTPAPTQPAKTTETPTPAVAVTTTPIPRPTEELKQPKNPEDVLYDVVYTEDEMTGVRQYWSAYNYEYYNGGFVFPKDLRERDNNLSNFDLSLVEQDGALKYCLTLRYQGDKWIFFDHWLVKIDDDEIVDFSLEDFKQKTDVNNGTVTERYTLKPGKDMQEIIKRIAECNACKMRFTGEKSYTFDLTEDEIKSTKHIVEMYEDYISG